MYGVSDGYGPLGRQSTLAALACRDHSGEIAWGWAEGKGRRRRGQAQDIPPLRRRRDHYTDCRAFLASQTKELQQHRSPCYGAMSYPGLSNWLAGVRPFYHHSSRLIAGSSWSRSSSPEPRVLLSYIHTMTSLVLNKVRQDKARQGKVRQERQDKARQVRFLRFQTPTAPECMLVNIAKHI